MPFSAQNSTAKRGRSSFLPQYVDDLSGSVCKSLVSLKVKKREVHVEDPKLTSYIWAENIGWISFSCEKTNSCATMNYGVTNDDGGYLSGYVWSENAGWISFSCEKTETYGDVDYGVVVDSFGEFGGQAWREDIGWISVKYSERDKV